jgi:hypothetical protein
MTPTRPRELLAIFLVVAVGVALIAARYYEEFPRFALSAPVSVVVIAVFEAFTASAIRARLDGRPGTKPILPILVARYAALAKASSLAAVVAAGIWGAIVPFAITHRDKFRYAGRDALLGGVGVLAAVALLVAALRLESACRIRRPPDSRDGVPNS